RSTRESWHLEHTPVTRDDPQERHRRPYRGPKHGAVHQACEQPQIARARIYAIAPSVIRRSAASSPPSTPDSSASSSPITCEARSTWMPPATWVASERRRYVWSGLSEESSRRTFTSSSCTKPDHRLTSDAPVSAASDRWRQLRPPKIP